MGNIIYYFVKTITQSEVPIERTIVIDYYYDDSSVEVLSKYEIHLVSV